MSGIALLGECMLELSPVSGATQQYALGVAGDTYNTAVALAQLGCETQYLSALGTDAHSEQIISRMAQYGVGTGSILRSASRQPGLYLIDNDSSGERFFSYWRQDSAARHALSDTAMLQQLLQSADAASHLYLTGISLALCGEDGRRQMLDWLRDWRGRGGLLIYDGNYRAALWPSLEEAQGAHRALLDHCDIFLPGVDDELVLQRIGSKLALTQRLQELEIPEILLKDGGNSLVLIEDGRPSEIELQPVGQVVDATGAGDSFNGGYLAARSQDRSPVTAAGFASKVAACTIAHPGAVLAPEHWESLRSDLARTA